MHGNKEKKQNTKRRRRFHSTFNSKFIQDSFLGFWFRFLFPFRNPIRIHPLTARCARCYQTSGVSTLYSIYSHLTGGNIDLNANQCNKTFFFFLSRSNFVFNLYNFEYWKWRRIDDDTYDTISLSVSLSLLGWLSKSTEVHVALSTMKIGS